MEEERGNVEISAIVAEPLINVPNPRALQQNTVVSNTTTIAPGQSRYIQLLKVIEELGREIRPCYAGSRSSAEKVKRGLMTARTLVRECLGETERTARPS
ncbi:PREDICTED: cyclin-dependent kinase 2-associated protein 1-like [Polistes dominula]|uniref:Cyclin-dependent kinase 2-associated protein 1-like n=1 Tax=Polistes dominula TaxID=743375 RepID=A0ABM1I6G7_POLDO|nr:PREDICTED: cyclin-dependent kinase 2-associated protein 1-like [Polistes dominula]